MPGGKGGGGGAGLLQPGGNGPGMSGSTDQAKEEKKPYWFIAVVDSDLYFRKAKEEELMTVTHRGGRTIVDLALLPKEKVVVSREAYDLGKQFNDQKSKLKGEDPFKFAEWMLQHWTLPVVEEKDSPHFGFDMEKKFEDYITTELPQLVKKDDAKAMARLQALTATRDQLHKPLGSPDEEMGRVRAIVGQDARALARDHYVVLHPSKLERMAEQKLKRLEHAYAAFYYWFALKGVALPAPQKQLIVILAEDAERFNKLHDIFDRLPLVCDGFYSALDNVLVLAAGRVDPRFVQFQLTASEIDKQLSDTSAGLNLKKLLQGTALSKKEQQDAEPKDLAYGRVIALAQAAAEEEGEISTVTHEVTQQLAAATGLLPRRVQVPSSVRLGIGSFFETTRSSGEWEFAALWSGVGSANHWVYLPLFRKIKDAEKSGTLSLDKDRKIKVTKPNILRIISDQEFAAADRAVADDQPVLRDVARADAWALTFFLAREKLPQLLKFYQELGRLPRDMELTGDIIEHAFAIAFDLQDSQNPNKLDTEKANRLEKEWRAYMDYQQLEINPATATPSDKKPKK
jgi:hypothetical protein